MAQRTHFRFRWVDALMRGFIDKLSEPIVTNRGLDLLAVFSWLCFAWWGIISTIFSLPSMAEASTRAYELVWGSSIGILGLTAAVAAFSTFFQVHGVGRILKRKVEFAAVILLTGLISVYPSVLIMQSIGGEAGRVAAVGGALYYLMFPIWRLIHLHCRMRSLKLDVAGDNVDSDRNG